MACVGVRVQSISGQDLREGSDTKEGMSSLAKINSHNITRNANHYLPSGWLTEAEAI